VTQLCSCDCFQGADDLEDLYTKVHAAIRENPSMVSGKEERDNSKKRTKARKSEDPTKYYNKRKISVQQRKNRVKQLTETSNMEELPMCYSSRFSNRTLSNIFGVRVRNCMQSDLSTLRASRPWCHSEPSLVFTCQLQPRERTLRV